MITSTLRGAIVGYGFIMEKGHAAAYRQRLAPSLGGGRASGSVHIQAIADVSESRRQLAAANFPGARIYTDAQSLLDAEAHQLDFVDIATPPSEHGPIAIAALQRGLHVLCEKPLATTIEDARAMLQQARSARRVLFPCHNYKHAPVIKKVRGLIDAGNVGNVHLVTLQTFRNTHARGVADWRPDWRRERRYSGGGIAMDHGSHTFYLAFEWMRSYPTAISARMSTLGPFDTEDDLSCSLRFPTGVASAHLSWQAGVRRVIYTIHGDRGAIRVEDDNVELCRAEDGVSVRGADVRWRFERSDVSSDWMDSSHVSWFSSLFDQFRTAIDNGVYVGREAEESFLCVQLIQTAYASARQGSRELGIGGTSALGFGGSAGGDEDLLPRSKVTDLSQRRRLG
jgi:predicted dehydrogenase